MKRKTFNRLDHVNRRSVECTSVTELQFSVLPIYDKRLQVV